MAQMNNPCELKILEDFIEIARDGKHVEAEVELRSYCTNAGDDSLPCFTDAVPNVNDHIDNCIMIADYTFKIGGQSCRLSKIYMFTTQADSLEQTRDNWVIANARLNVDYKRLKAVHIDIVEKYF